jgi:hypothetical protein
VAFSQGRANESAALPAQQCLQAFSLEAALLQSDAPSPAVLQEPPLRHTACRRNAEKAR